MHLQASISLSVILAESLMPRLSVLIDDFAERFSFEQTKLTNLARSLREAGLITSGARGVHAPPATPLDAARLLIAMMLGSKLPTVVEDVRLVGSFTALDPSKFTPVFAPETLEDGLATLISYAGSAPDRHFDDLALLGFELEPYAALGAIEIMYAREANEDEEGDEDGLIIRHTRIAFTHPDVRASENGPLPEAYIAAAKRFPTGFYQKPEIRKDNLIAVGKLVMSADQ